jgi:atypical dual specificity phosphatase
MTKKKTNVKGGATLIYPPSLYLGPCSAASSSAFLDSHSIKNVLSIGATPSTQIPGVTYHRLALTDSQYSPIAKVIDAAFEIIDEAVSEKEVGAGEGKILIHCSAAVSRSPTIMAAYLMARHKLTLKEALGHIVFARPIVSPNPGFLRQLRELEKELYGYESLDIEELPRRREDRKMLFSDCLTL